jgi:hypothetical protein
MFIEMGLEPFVVSVHDMVDRCGREMNEHNRPFSVYPYLTLDICSFKKIRIPLRYVTPKVFDGFHTVKIDREGVKVSLVDIKSISEIKFAPIKAGPMPPQKGLMAFRTCPDETGIIQAVPEVTGELFFIDFRVKRSPMGRENDSILFQFDKKELKVIKKTYVTVKIKNRIIMPIHEEMDHKAGF